MEVFDAYNKYFYKLVVYNSGDLLSEPVCFNKRILVGKKIIVKEQWIEHGVICIGDFLNDKGKFYSYSDFKTKYNITVDFITFTGCSMSLKKYIKNVEFLLLLIMSEYCLPCP